MVGDLLGPETGSQGLTGKHKPLKEKSLPRVIVFRNPKCTPLPPTQLASSTVMAVSAALDTYRLLEILRKQFLAAEEAWQLRKARLKGKTATQQS